MENVITENTTKVIKKANHIDIIIPEHCTMPEDYKDLPDFMTEDEEETCWLCKRNSKQVDLYDEGTGTPSNKHLFKLKDSSYLICDICIHLMSAIAKQEFYIQMSQIEFEITGKLSNTEEEIFEETEE